MSYFDDMVFLMGAEVPRCVVSVDQGWPDMYNFQFRLAGEMLYGIDGGPVQVMSEPVAFWHHPAHRYRYGPAVPGGSWHHFWVTFRGDRARRIIEEGFMPLSPDHLVPVVRAQPFTEVFRELVNRVGERPGTAQPEATVLLERLLAMLIAEQTARRQGTDAIRDLALLVREYPCRDWDFRQEAADLGMSYHHLRRRFRDAMECGPHDYLLTCRMQHAAGELAATSRPVKAIASETGYPDAAQFSKLFKSRLGLSPKLFRDAMPGGPGEGPPTGRAATR